MKRILIPTAGTHSAFECAEYVMAVAQSINAQVHVLNVISSVIDSGFEDASAAIKVFELASEVSGVRVTGVVRAGEVVEQTIKYAAENDINLIMMGASRGAIVEQWLSSEVLGHSAIPVLVMPAHILESVSAS